MTVIEARPTIYNGIQMRSRLEANVAQRLLDAFHAGRWAYEPECFASADGQYLPDFHADDLGYIEVKPDSIEPIKGPVTNPDTSQIDGILERMEIIWASRPRAKLFLLLWEYDVGAKHIFSADGWDYVWWWHPNLCGSWTLWPGRGQLATLQASSELAHR
jgi:hypothetical protein